MNDASLTNRELLLAVDNDNNATPRELELAKRLRRELQLDPIPRPADTDAQRAWPRKIAVQKP